MTAARGRSPQEKRYAEREQDRQSVPVAHGVAEAYRRTGQRLGDPAVRREPRNQALRLREAGDHRDAQGQSISPRRAVAAPRRSDGEREHAQIQSEAREARERAFRAWCPERRKRREHREGGQKNARDQRRPRWSGARPGALRYGQQKRPP